MTSGPRLIPFVCAAAFLVFVLIVIEYATPRNQVMQTAHQEKAASAPIETFQGPVLVMAREPYVIVGFIFHQGARGHAGALRTLWGTAEDNRGKLFVTGVVGVRSEQDKAMAQRLRFWRDYDTMVINGKEESVLPDSRGQPRKVRFKGYEGKDYSLENLEQVLRLELGKKKVQALPKELPPGFFKSMSKESFYRDKVKR